jgi:hypothetical protein
MPCSHPRRYPLGRTLVLGLLACLAAAPAAHGQATYDAEATAFVTIGTPASPTFTITTTPGVETLSTFASAIPPATASATASVTETDTAPTISDDAHVFDATGGIGQSATSSASASDTGLTLTVTNLSTNRFVYDATYDTTATASAPTTRPGETASASALAQILLNGGPFSGNSFTLAPGASDVWTIEAIVNGSAFSPALPAAVPEPGSIALLLGMGLTGAGFLRKRRRR